MKHLCVSFLAVTLLSGPASARADQAEALVAGARQEGLPVEVLQNKIHEGRAKGVPEGRIVAVVSQLARHLRTEGVWLRKQAARKQAKGAKQPQPAHKGLWIAMAEARMAGLDSKALRELVRRSGHAQLATQRIDALVDLRLRGYKGKGATALVKRVKAKDLRGLGQTIERARTERGLSQGEVLDGLVRGLGRGRHLREAVRGLGPGAGQGAQYRYGRGQGGAGSPGGFGPGRQGN